MPRCAAAAAGVLVAVLVLAYGGARASASLTVAEHVAEGNRRIAAGDLSSALDHFHAACENEPDNYMHFFKRATVYLGMGRTRQALKDLNKVLSLKPEFEQARTRRADLLLKKGDYAGAREDLAALGNSPAVQEKLASVQNAEQLAAHAEQHLAAGNFNDAVHALSAVIEISPNDVKLRKKRAECYEQVGMLGEAIGDMMRVTKLRSSNAESFLVLSRLQYKTGARADALAQIRECVKLEDDNKACRDFYKMLKKFNKVADKIAQNLQQNRWAEALLNINKAREIENTTPFYVEELLVQEAKALINSNKHKEAMEACNKALKINERNIDTIMLKAQAYEGLEEFETATQIWKQALEIDSNNGQAKEGLGRAERLLKQANKRDYYKILGVPRNANKKQISKAYRGLAQEWHPDKFESEEDKKMAEKKFMDIAAAKEMFDNGEDPLDAEEERQRQRGGHHGFNPFAHANAGGGRFHFKFN